MRPSSWGYANHGLPGCDKIMSRHYDDNRQLQIRLQWSPNAWKGFGGAVVICSLVVLMSTCVRVEPPHVRELPATTGVTLLVFGDGDGTGARKGNLTAEGVQKRGEKPDNPLADARQAARSPDGTTPASDPTQTTRPVPSANVGDRSKDSARDGGAVAIGGRDGTNDGTGLGVDGRGSGRGLGLGDIDWGGGGNRTVVFKQLPKYPPGTLNTAVKLRFRVMPDGTVSSVIPVRRGGNPAVDDAAMEALRRWRFNKRDDGIEMEGTITFTFKSS